MAGHCFEEAWDKVLQLEPSGARLLIVHGTPIGQGPENMGRRFWHAWVEIETSGGWVVIDPKGNFRRADYYRVGQIVPRLHVIRFTLQQAREAGERYGHFGPWTDDTKASEGVLTERTKGH